MSDPRLAALLERSGRILFFTGAGISTGSGIPDYRGPNGLWTAKQREPIYYQEFLRDPAKRLAYWEHRLEDWTLYRDAPPTPVHRAIAALEKRGKVAAVVTQNIDGLHLKAGSRPETLFELHGHYREVVCVKCGKTDAPDAAVDSFRAVREVPRCGCGGPLKFAIISFGQPLVPAVIEGALDAARRCDLVFALGSTLSVYPAASVPLLAAQRGVPYVIVNRGVTDHDSLATLRFEGDVADHLGP